MEVYWSIGTLEQIVSQREVGGADHSTGSFSVGEGIAHEPEEEDGDDSVEQILEKNVHRVLAANRT